MHMSADASFDDDQFSDLIAPMEGNEAEPLAGLEAFTHLRSVIKGGKVIERKTPAK